LALTGNLFLIILVLFWQVVFFSIKIYKKHKQRNYDSMLFKNTELYNSLDQEELGHVGGTTGEERYSYSDSSSENEKGFTFKAKIVDK
jgi:hypothetical protein